MQYRALLSSLTKAIQSGDLTILVGAGVSTNSPSLLPLATELRDLITAAVFCHPNRSAASHLLRHLAVLRPEVVLGVLYRTFGMGALDALDCLDGRPPNVIHYLLARCLSLGNTVCTTNFDGLIEEACRHLGSPFTICADDATALHAHAVRHLLFKIHGTLRDAAGTNRKDTIVATLDQVGRGLSVPKALLLTDLVRQKPTLVLGYSGLDEFDILPCLRQARTSQAVYWVAHATTGPPVITTTRQLKGRAHPDALDVLLLDCFPNSVRVDADTVRFTADLLRQSGGVLATQAPSPTTHAATIMQWGAQLARYDRFRAQGRLLEEAGRLSEALRAYRRAYAVAALSGDQRKKCRSLDDIAFLHGAQGRYRSAMSAYGRMEHAAQNDIDRGRALFGQAKASRALGDPKAAVRRLQTAQRLFTNAGRTDLATSLLHDLGQSYLLLGEYRRARLLFRRREKFFQKYGELDKVAWSRAGRATARCLEGNFAAAHRLLEQVARRFGHILGAFDRAWVLAYLGDALRMCGDLVEAERSYAEAATIFRRIGERGGSAFVDLGHAEIERIRGRYPAAVRLYRKHLRYLRRAGRRLLLAHALLGIAETARVSGQPKPDYRTPRRMYERMGVPWGVIYARIGEYCDLDSRKDPHAAWVATKVERLIRKYGFVHERAAWNRVKKTRRIALNFP